jgi:hypothetical protein
MRRGALPWRRPQHELLLLALVAFAALTPVYVVNAQDVSHFCLTRAMTAGELKIDDCGGDALDRSVYNGHSYSNKAPGMSLFAVPSAEAVRLRTAPSWNNVADPRLWGVRVLSSGIAFMLCVFLVGRVAEGIAAGTGGLTLVAFGLGTLAYTFAASGFDHDLTALSGFGAFVLAWARRPALAGLAAGAAYLVEYQAAAFILLVALYVLLGGVRPLARYALGVVPGVVLSSAYSWAAFGAPGRNPHNYEVNKFQGVNPNSGVLGIHLPSWHGIHLVFAGDRGLLVVSPVVAAAAIGLVLLWRRGYRAEALVAGVVTAAFVIGDCGYGDPYGGLSPGPRYITPALPFLALGLAPAFARWRVPTAVLAAYSVFAGMVVGLTWAASASSHYRETVWGELVRVVSQQTDSRLYGDLAKNLLTWAGPSAGVAAVAVFAAAAAAFVVAAAKQS